MNTTLLDGPGRALESIHPKFMVELVLGIDNPRLVPVAAQQQIFRERLMNEIMAQTQLRPWAMSGMFSENPTIRLGLVEKLAGMLDPGHLALTRMSDCLETLQLKASSADNIQAQYAKIREQFRQRAAHKQRALSQRGLVVQAGEHSEQVFNRWQTGQYDGWSLAGRCYVALEELRWGAFGDACRLANSEVTQLLKDNVSVMASQLLAQSINAAPATRHFYHQWLTTPGSTGSGLVEHKDMLGWLGGWCDAERHPLSWSVTQSWQTVALGMPRLCSAMRLVNGMVEEVFGELN